MGNDMLSDISLVVAARRIPAHKLVLANASPVFAQMFQSDMQESATGEVRSAFAHRKLSPCNAIDGIDVHQGQSLFGTSGHPSTHVLTSPPHRMRPLLHACR